MVSPNLFILVASNEINARETTSDASGTVIGNNNLEVVLAYQNTSVSDWIKHEGIPIG